MRGEWEEWEGWGVGGVGGVGSADLAQFCRICMFLEFEIKNGFSGQMYPPPPSQPNLVLNQTTIGMKCAHCPASPVFWDGHGSMVCEEHKAYVDLSMPQLGPRFEALYAAASSLIGVQSDVDGSQSKKECGLCLEEICIGAQFVTCGNGHVACKECTSSYVEKTLLPVRTVWLDNIKCCVDSDCIGVFDGKAVSGCLAEETIMSLEKSQMDVSYLLAGKLDSGRRELIDNDTKECPACGVIIFKADGCSHVKCRMCCHDFWFTCGHTCKNYPFHEEGCADGFAQNEVSLV